MQADCGFPTSPELFSTGPTIAVRIGFDAEYAEAGQAPHIGETLYAALVDTGAVFSCIDAQLAAALQLPVVDQVELVGAGGRHLTTQHLAQIYVPALDFTVYGRFAAVRLFEGGPGHQAILGRHFLQFFLFQYEGASGRATLFRMQ